MNQTSWSTINPDRELLLFGIVYSVTSSIVFPVYALIIHALHSRNDLRENVTYRLLNILNYCDVSQAFCHFLTGLFLIFPVFTKRLQVFVRIVGCTVNTLWIATFIIVAILSSTRIGIVVFKTNSTKWSTWTKVALAAGSLYIFLVWAIGCATQNFELTGPNWSYDLSIEYAALFADLELIVCCPVIAFNFTSYVLICWSISKKRRITQTSSSMRTEIGILIQAAILTAYMAILITLWHNAEILFEVTNVTLASINLMWILFSHLNSILLITTNRGVRRQILNLFFSDNRPEHTSRIGRLTHVSSTPVLEKL